MINGFNKGGIGNGIDKGGSQGGTPGVISTSSTKFAGAEIKINSPRGRFVGENFRVAGTATVRKVNRTMIKHKGDMDEPEVTTTESFVTNTDTSKTEDVEIKIRVGDEVHQPDVSVRGNRVHWEQEIKNAHAGSLTISAELKAHVREMQSDSGGGDSHHHSEIKTVQRDDLLDVTIDTDIPDVNIISHLPSSRPTWKVAVVGEADDRIGLQSVRWVRHSQGIANESGEANNLSDDWSRWRADIPLERRDVAHTIEIIATDKMGREGSREVDIPADDQPPKIIITDPGSSPPPHTEIWKEGGVALEVIGTAKNIFTDIETVEWSLNDGRFEPVTKQADDWTNWSFKAELDRPGTYTIRIRAADAAGNVTEKGEETELVVEVKELFVDV